MADEIRVETVNLPRCKGGAKVYVQGASDVKHQTVFLTVHDIGTSPRSWIDFVNHPSMVDVKAKARFLHFAVPGQEEDAVDWPFHDYPSLGDIGQDLSAVLDFFDVAHCVVMGEGAGANIACRFAMAMPKRVIGLVLVKCTSTTAGVMEYIKDKFINLKMESGKMNPSTYQYLLSHRFGQQVDENNESVQRYMDDLKTRQNIYNLSKYLSAFVKRTDLSTYLGKQLQSDCLLVVGAQAAHLHTVYTMHQNMNRERTTLLVVDGVGDVSSEAPEKLTRGIILFCKGLGALTGVHMPGMERQRSLCSSMEEADRPTRKGSSSTGHVGAISKTQA